MNKLWTKDFTIITLGTVVSMLGSSMSGFGIGLLVLDYTGSTLMYAVFMVAYCLPRVVMPLLSGPYLDSFSRRKTIYTLDFTSAGLFLLFFLIIRFELFNYALLLFFSLVIGTIDSVYQVAYDSLYPNLVPEGCFRQAYSVSSMIYPLAAMMVPVASYIYDRVGLAPIFLFNAVSFLIAAVAETRISDVETHMSARREHYSMSRYVRDFREGLSYIASQKGLLVITAYFLVCTFCEGSYSTLVLPWFRSRPELGVQLYTYIMAAAVFGRLIGGFLQYRFRYPANRKFAIALFVYAAINVMSVSLLYLPVAVMFLFQFLIGILGVTSYNIRISATQSFVPDTVRARFNGTFSMLCSLGGIAGQLLSGAMGERMSMRLVVALFFGFNLLAVLVMWVGREAVKPIYNREV